MFHSVKSINARLTALLSKAVCMSVLSSCSQLTAIPARAVKARSRDSLPFVFLCRVFLGGLLFEYLLSFLDLMESGYIMLPSLLLSPLKHKMHCKYGPDIFKIVYIPITHRIHLSIWLVHFTLRNIIKLSIRITILLCVFNDSMTYSNILITESQNVPTL